MFYRNQNISSKVNRKIDLIIKDTGIDDVKSEDEVISTEVIPINCIDNTNCSQ
jgi:RNA:NAD 2'-phosphotransferase (TPT1/KptA family)